MSWQRSSTVHFYTFEKLGRVYAGGPDQYVAACNYHIFEQKCKPPEYLPGTPPFYHGTEDPAEVTCENCKKTKKYKKAITPQIRLNSLFGSDSVEGKGELCPITN